MKRPEKRSPMVSAELLTGEESDSVLCGSILSVEASLGRASLSKSRICYIEKAKCYKNIKFLNNFVIFGLTKDIFRNRIVTNSSQMQEEYHF